MFKKYVEKKTFECLLKGLGYYLDSNGDIYYDRENNEGYIQQHWKAILELSEKLEELLTWLKITESIEPKSQKRVIRKNGKVIFKEEIQDRRS